MLTLRAARTADVDGFALDARQAAVMPQWWMALNDAMLAGTAMTVLRGDRVLAFGGLATIWPGRACAWCFLSADIPIAAWVPATRLARAVLDASGIARIEADIRDDFPPAARWARMLGFCDEGPMPAYWQGATYRRFARIA